MTDPDWRHLPSLSSLRAFEAAARLGGFSAAARALNVTHAAVAQQVRGLEAELGLTLFRREGRGLALTPVGARLTQALSEGFGAIARGVEDARLAERERGLRVTSTPAFAQSVLLPRLGNFWAAHPDVPITLTPGFDLVDLARDGYDVAIRSGQGDWPGLVAEPLLRTRVVLVGTPALAGRDPDISRLPWILSSKDTLDDQWLATAGLYRKDLVVHALDEPMLAVAAGLQGYGLFFATDIIVAQALAEGHLTELPFPGLPDFNFWIATLPGTRSPALEAFVAWLKETFADAPAVKPGG
ncbi:LysR substrate-binding domain-containing protein [Frigidibacter sp. ROC022]|uniref:LysR substrate-binding domain-containing protein n=1 Tax=Frigidibacter sp. ROC022 TaxID=2971796 RepID=UPI00215B3868|nr:LysR substrate-binding domain-containing protein [Frigidibacter sp. ROC022]MCR8724497.1 LysR substrate-binding domain-containing protein [Frigidibacter sp. ROC022]